MKTEETCLKFVGFNVEVCVYLQYFNSFHFYKYFLLHFVDMIDPKTLYLTGEATKFHKPGLDLLQMNILLMQNCQIRNVFFPFPQVRITRQMGMWLQRTL